MDIKKNIMNKIIVILLILFTANICIAEDWDNNWEVESVNKLYLKDDFNTTPWHAGIGLLYGKAQYLNIDYFNNFSKYMMYIRINSEIDYYKYGFVIRLMFAIEDEMFTDELTWYGNRSKMQGIGLAGISMKFPFFFNFINSWNPYLLIGGGYTSMDYEHTFLSDTGYVFNTQVEGRGPLFGGSLGVEFEFMKNLLFIDLGMNYFYNFNISQEMEDNSFDNDNDDDQNRIEVGDPIKEIEMNFYFGFSFNLI